MLEFLCPTCGKRVQGDDSFAGKTVVCPGCNATMTAPNAAIVASEHLRPTASSDTAISEGLPPQEAPPPSVRTAAPHVVKRMTPYAIVAGVLTLLVLLLVPAVQKVREAAARTQATNNLKQIALCFSSYHDVTKKLPSNGTVRAKAGDLATGCWGWQILPFLESSPIFNDGPEKHLHHGIQAYMCPGRGRQSFCSTGPWSDYAINPWLNDAKNGVVNAPHSDRTMVGITDGISNTIFVGQASIDPNLYGSVTAIPQSTDIFKGGDPATARRSTKNHRDTAGDGELTWGGPFPQGCLVGMGDGTVRMFPYSITGGEIRDGTSTHPDPRPFGDGRTPPDFNHGLGKFLTPCGGEPVTLPD